MRTLPDPDPGTPNSRSAAHYQWWLARVHSGPLTAAAVLMAGWLGCQALLPWALGRSLDAVVATDTGELLRWLGVLAALGITQAVSGVVGHRYAVLTWIGPAYRTVQVITRQVARLGASLPKRISAGEVVAVGTSDIDNLGGGTEVIGRGIGALVAVGIVTTVMVNTSTSLGLVVIIGVPLVMLVLAPPLRRLHHRQQAHRELVGALTGRANDIVTGLRVLRGIGGEAAFADRYRTQSQRVRQAGVGVARVQALLDGLQMLLPGLFVVVVVWLGARMAMSGALTPGQLVAFYGYAAFLGAPLWHLSDAANKLTRAHVSARRVVKILQLAPEIADPPAPADRTDDRPYDRADDRVAGGELVDAESGLRIRPGTVIGLAADPPAAAVALADRLGRFTDGEVSWGGVPLRELAVAEVRRRILVADNGARLFSGRLRTELDIRAERSGPAAGPTIAAALHTASAEDILDGLEQGLDTEISDGGREFSGGQRQRLLLARALLADPEVLILVEPTSAVDAHTEAEIAERLARHRRGRTTVVVTTSPLLLDRMDTVAYLAEGKVLATGPHRRLLTDEPRYAAAVTRGED